jgi:uncharacterized protein (TIGR02118 family)
MFKVIWALKRKPGLDAEAFRRHFETSHAPLAVQHFGRLLLEYRRNYVSEVGGPGAAADGGPGFDCFSEWTMADESVYREIQQILAVPEVGRAIAEDSRMFIDNAATVVFTTTVVESRLG